MHVNILDDFRLEDGFDDALLIMQHIRIPFIYKNITHTPGSGQQTEPRTRAETNRAKYRGTQPK